LLKILKIQQKVFETRKCGNCDALQLEADAAPVVIRFSYDAHTKVQVGQPIRFCVEAFSLLIRYITL